VLFDVREVEVQKADGGYGASGERVGEFFGGCGEEVES